MLDGDATRGEPLQHVEVFTKVDTSSSWWRRPVLDFATDLEEGGGQLGPLALVNGRVQRGVELVKPRQQRRQPIHEREHWRVARYRRLSAPGIPWL